MRGGGGGRGADDLLYLSLEYQFGNVVEQLAFFKGKAESQRQVLSKLGGELKKLRKVAR